MIPDGHARVQLPQRMQRPVNSPSLIAPGGLNGASLDRACPVCSAHRLSPMPAARAMKVLLVAGRVNPGALFSSGPDFAGFFNFLDDKINVASIFGLIKHFQEEQVTPKYTIQFIISTYEEVGHGASFIPELDEMIAVDMGCIGDDLTCTEYDVSICPKDSSGPYDYELTNRLIDIAKANDINHAIDIYPFYGSDVSAAIRGGNDFKGALMGPGVHASHGMERTHVKAIEATISLLFHYFIWLF